MLPHVTHVWIKVFETRQQEHKVLRSTGFCQTQLAFSFYKSVGPFKHQKASLFWFLSQLAEPVVFLLTETGLHHFWQSFFVSESVVFIVFGFYCLRTQTTELVFSGDEQVLDPATRIFQFLSEPPLVKASDYLVPLRIWFGATDVSGVCFGRTSSCFVSVILELVSSTCLPKEWWSESNILLLLCLWRPCPPTSTE